MTKALGIHGLGDQRNSGWEKTWEEVLAPYFLDQGSKSLRFETMNYDSIFFNKVDLSAQEIAVATGKLLWSGIWGEKRFLGKVRAKLRATAGYVVAWVEDEVFQRKTRELFFERLEAVQPDVIFAHSLGSLVSFNAITHKDAESFRDLLKKVTYVSLGSQIGNPFVVRNLAMGRIQPLRVKMWYHLYNRHDDVFTSPIRLHEADNFLQVECHHDEPGDWGDHSATYYFQHPETEEHVYEPLLNRSRSKEQQEIVKSFHVRIGKGVVRRAFLCGVNAYPNPADRLEGCVNDVYLVNEVLQELGYEEDEVRLLLDERATAEGILERLEWLVRDARAGDQLFFYFSGHGTQVVSYGNHERVDYLDECLAPVDFDFDRRDTWILDDRIFELYAQLPFDARLILMFDCCHSGDIHRQGGQRAKGLTPPDDIRHRGMKWEKDAGKWSARTFDALHEDFAGGKRTRQAYFGKTGSLRKFGRASRLRGIKGSTYRRLKRETSAPIGPYAPTVLTACDEDEKAIEYTVGSQNFGAFTWFMAKALRASDGILDFEQLVNTAAEQMRDEGIVQCPKVFGARSPFA